MELERLHFQHIVFNIYPTFKILNILPKFDEVHVHK